MATANEVKDLRDRLARSEGLASSLQKQVEGLESIFTICKQMAAKWRYNPSNNDEFLVRGEHFKAMQAKVKEIRAERGELPKDA